MKTVREIRLLAGRRCSWQVGLAMALLVEQPSPAQEVVADDEAGVAVRLNSVGYLPKSSKRATVAGGGDDFIVSDVQTRTEIYRGRLAALNSSEADSERLSIADFSKVEREGTFQIEVANVGKSPSFRVADDVFNWPLYCVARAMYLWRCGTSVSTTLGPNTFQHDACHVHDASLDYVGGLAAVRKDGTGGWHDAGDYNKYTVNGAFTAGMLLRAYEDFADELAKVRLDIPESGNDVPDLLDEVRWELDWLFKMQADDGRVFHKVSTRRFGGFILPERETEARHFSPWSSAATASFAAVMAQAARVFQPIDAAYADRCMNAARKSYAYLAEHPQEHRPDLSAFSTGRYHAPDRDDRIWAAAELWESTGDERYLRDFESRVTMPQPGPRGRQRGAVSADWDWSNLSNLGSFAYLLSQRAGRNPEIVDHLHHETLAVADAIVAAADRHPYARTLDAKYYWGCNGTVARQTINLHVAFRLTNDPRYRAAMLDAINHLLGRNPYGRSYVTGLGHRPPLFPHDRRSAGDNIVAPWPGYLVGGAWPEAGDWRDDQNDYRTNEIAINWNGALIYALAAFIDVDEFDASVAAMKPATEPSGTSTPADSDN